MQAGRARMAADRQLDRASGSPAARRIRDRIAKHQGVGPLLGRKFRLPRARASFLACLFQDLPYCVRNRLTAAFAVNNRPAPLVDQPDRELGYLAARLKSDVRQRSLQFATGSAFALFTRCRRVNSSICGAK